MLPVFTTQQVKDGITSGDFMIDLSDYMKKKDAATKVDLNNLTSVVANKLDKEPQHNHHISDIKELQEALQSKYDTSEKYSFNTIISDIEKIPYLEGPKIKLLEITKNTSVNGYKVYVDDASGDLMISYDDILIANYTKSTSEWSFGGVKLNQIPNLDGVNAEISLLQNQNVSYNDRITTNLTKINTLNEQFSDYIAKTDAVLKNHYDALLMLCEKHGMVDSNTNDGDKVSPE